jgi:DNA-binding IclR family transcriptional regulator
MDGSSRTVGRVLQVLEQFSVSPHPLTNGEIAARLRVPASSMHRLLQKLTELGFLDINEESASYAISPSLSGLGRRLADIGGYLPPLRTTMSALRAHTGGTVSIWLPAGVYMRLSAILLGRVPGASTNAIGELREPFSTPGLAMATTYSRERLAQLTRAARRRGAQLGRRFRTMRDITSAVQQVTQRGYAVGFNLRSDGWGIIAWPVPMSADQERYGVIAVGMHVPELRSREQEIAAFADRLLQRYRKELRTYAGDEFDGERM